MTMTDLPVINGVPANMEYLCLQFALTLKKIEQIDLVDVEFLYLNGTSPSKNLIIKIIQFCPKLKVLRFNFYNKIKLLKCLSGSNFTKDLTICIGGVFRDEATTSYSKPLNTMLQSIRTALLSEKYVTSLTEIKSLSNNGFKPATVIIEYLNLSHPESDKSLSAIDALIFAGYTGSDVFQVKIYLIALLKWCKLGELIDILKPTTLALKTADEIVLSLKRRKARIVLHRQKIEKERSWKEEYGLAIVKTGLKSNEQLKLLLLLKRYGSELNERHLTLLNHRASGLTLSEIAETQGVSRERIRQIEVKSLKKLYKCFRAEKLLNK